MVSGNFQERFKRFQISLEDSERFHGRFMRKSGGLRRFQVIARMFQGVSQGFKWRFSGSEVDLGAFNGILEAILRIIRFSGVS